MVAAVGAAAAVACGRPGRHGRDVVVASGAELESVNPLVTVHPLANEIDRYVLLTTLARRDSALVPTPYLARAWQWTADRRTLRLVLVSDLVWADGTRTSARDVVWTLDVARDPATGYPRAADLAVVAGERAVDDSTVVIRFTTAQPAFPDVLTDLAILPAHLLDTVARAHLRAAEWNAHPIGNGPFRFVLHEPGRWVFEANAAFPATLGGPPRVARLVVVVVSEPMTKLAGLVDGELDVAGVLPTHAAFVRRDPALRLLDYPMLFPYGVIFNVRRPPFSEYRTRLAAALAIDRAAIVRGYLSGFGSPAWGPVPPGHPGAEWRRARTPGSGLGATTAGPRRPVRAALRRLWGRGARTNAAGRPRPGGVRGPHSGDRAVGILGSRVRTPARLRRRGARDPGATKGLDTWETLVRVAGFEPRGDARAMQRLFDDSVPVAFLYYARGVQGVSRRLRGVRMDLRGELVSVASWDVAP